MTRWYFDHAAATPVLPEVIKEMEPYWANDFANPSAIYAEGVLAREAIDRARGRIAGSLGVHEETCLFTSSATESIFLALAGAVRAWKKDHPEERAEIIVSAIEHDAVLEAAHYLEREDVLVHRIPVNSEGFVYVSALESLLNERTVVVSIGLVNNEIGVIQPISEIARLLRKWKKDYRGVTRDRAARDDELYPLLHTDGTQAICYYGLNIAKLGVDMFSCNSSKIYGPKGAGLLYRGLHVRLEPVIVGGGQEYGMRAGTEPVALIAGFAEAFVLAQQSAIEETFRLLPLRELLIAECTRIANKLSIKIKLNGPVGENRIVNNVNISFENVNHEYLSLLLDNEGFAVATKSACNEREAEESHVLFALSVAKDNEGPSMLSGLRFTMGRSTTEEGIRALVLGLEKVLPIAVNSK